MPQMSPMWWTSLFMMFTVCLIIVMMMTYFYIYKMNLKMSSQNMSTNNKTWKW
uniref:ATP synthase complex subunit 8 n=1 Tax=Scotomedes sp. TaxID=2931908 RepID=A0A8T9VZP8_9HEMI|nr:ATPase subunit 8 [Scotomedes sp.]